MPSGIAGVIALFLGLPHFCSSVCVQFVYFFFILLLLCIILNANRRTKMGEEVGLGTRLLVWLDLTYNLLPVAAIC